MKTSVSQEPLAGAVRGKEGGPTPSGVQVKVYVNLETNTATIQVVRRVPIFTGPANRFVIEGDSGGFSAIEKRGEDYYEINRILSEPKPLEEKHLTPLDVKRIIRETLVERYFLAVRW
jgi:hypothetical protein